MEKKEVDQAPKRCYYYTNRSKGDDSQMTLCRIPATKRKHGVTFCPVHDPDLILKKLVHIWRELLRDDHDLPVLSYLNLMNEITKKEILRKIPSVKVKKLTNLDLTSDE